MRLLWRVGGARRSFQKGQEMRKAIVLAAVGFFLAFQAVVSFGFDEPARQGVQADAPKEVPPHWMDEIIRKCRKMKIERRQIRCIKEGIAAHEEGKEIAKHPKIDDAIKAGLKAAIENEKNTEDAKPSPAAAAREAILKYLEDHPAE